MGDVVNLTDATGATVASYSYDTWGALTASSESLPNAGGWVNPYRYDGRDRVLADPADGLDWLATRAYAPSTGRFLARDPLGRAPLFFADNPYTYAGNNPVSNVDPTGQYRAAGHGAAVRESGAATNRLMARVVAKGGCGQACKKRVHSEWVSYHIGLAKGIAKQASAYFAGQIKSLPGSLLHGINAQIDPGIILGSFGTAVSALVLLKALELLLLTGATATGSGLLGALGAVAAVASPLWIEMIGGFVIYDLVASAYQWMFQHESTAGKGFWLSSDGLDRHYNMTIAAMLVSFLGAAAWAVPFTLMAPGLAALWIGTAAVTVAMIAVKLEQRAFAYLEQEGAVWGYLVH